MTSLQTFSYHFYFMTLIGKIFLGVCFYGSRKFWTEACNIREKGKVSQCFFLEFSKFQKIVFFLDNFQKSICSGVFGPVVDCSPAISLKENSSTSNLQCFSKIPVQLFQNILMEISVMKFRGLPVCRLYSPVFLLKINPPETPQNFSKILEIRLYPPNLCDGFLFWQQPTTFLRINLCKDVFLLVIVNFIKFETHSDGLQFQ